MVTYSNLGKCGRIANQLFQIASTIGIAERNGMKAIFPHWKYSKYFKNKINNGLVQFNDTYVEKSFLYTDVLLDKEKKYNLIGYFQSEKYFKHCEKKIKDLFTFSDSLINTVNEKNQFNKLNTVSVHVRRGDYLQKSDYHTNLTIEWYEHAMSIFPYHTFIFFSDDIKWCEQQFGVNHIYIDNQTDIEDLYLMSTCSSNIIANSSFSWWASYLNANENKKIIAPKYWFGKEFSEDENDWKDIYRSDMIII